MIIKDKLSFLNQSKDFMTNIRMIGQHMQLSDKVKMCEGMQTTGAWGRTTDPQGHHRGHITTRAIAKCKVILKYKMNESQNSNQTILACRRLFYYSHDRNNVEKKREVREGESRKCVQNEKVSV